MRFIFSEEMEWIDETDKIISGHLFIFYYYKSALRVFNYLGNSCQHSKKYIMWGVFMGISTVMNWLHLETKNKATPL